jgi:hypothetical protein
MAAVPGSTRKGWTTGAVAALLGGALIAAPAQAQEIERLAGDAVAIYNLAGQVEVVAGTGPDVVVRMNVHGRDGARLSLERGSAGGRETLSVLYPSDEVIYPEMGRGSTTSLNVRADGTFSDGRGGGGERVRVRGTGDGLEAWADLVVEVPAGRSTEIYLAVGRVEARGVDGDVRLDTGSGDVRALDIDGSLLVDTGSGRVEVSDIRGDVLVDTGSGQIDAARLAGEEVELDTGSGRIVLDGVEARMLRVDTGSGAVRVSGARSADIEVDTGSGSVEVEIISGVRRLLVDTGSGAVTLRIPRSFGAEIEVETGSGRIDVDLPMEVRTARRDVLRGRIGDGSGTITVDTGSGNIRILAGG